VEILFFFSLKKKRLQRIAGNSSHKTFRGISQMLIVTKSVF